jgi:hypothetical protein
MRAPPHRIPRLLLLALGACAAPGPGGPVPLSVVPSQGSPSAATPVEISGVGFDADVKTDYGDGSGSTVQAVFAARLLPWDGSPAVDLAPVALTQRRTLTALVPAGLAPGRYDLQVTDPAGRSGTLPDGFEVTSSASDVVGFRIATIQSQRAAVPFTVSVEAVDAAGRVVTGFSGSVSVLDESGTAAPAAAGPFALGRVQAQLAVAVPYAGDRLTVDDGAGRTGLSNDFDVGPGVPARIDFVGGVAASASACSGAFELELRDAGGAPAPAVADVNVALQSGPPGALLLFSDAGCSVPAPTLVIPAGATRGAFRLRGAAAGTASLRAVPDVLPSAETAVAILP